MAGAAKPSREDELRALQGMLSGEALEAVHAWWLEEGVDPELEAEGGGDSLMLALREADSGIAELERLDSAYERLADEVAERTGELRASLMQQGLGTAGGSGDETASAEVPKDARDSVEIAPGTTQTLSPVAKPVSTPAPLSHPAGEATFLSNPAAEANLPPQLTSRDGYLATPTEAELVPGFELGAYRIVRRLGQGGMGSVFLAEHVRMERQVALKTLSPAMSRDPQAVKRFHREVKAAAKLSHPNIVTAYDADEARGLQMLVMEFVDGTDLSVWVKKEGALPVREAVDCVLQAARGLEFAHSKGVVHRDIKPANLLRDKAGVVKVLDMGLARIGEFDETAAAGLTSTGTIMGTAEFMAPEQALDTRTAGAPADIYSLGCTLYYLLTGKAPFTGDTVMKILLAHRDRAVPKLGDVLADVPDRLDTLFQRMIAKRVEDRCQSMGEVIAELEAIRDGVLKGSVLNPGGGPLSLTEAIEEMSRSQAIAPTRAAGIPVAKVVAKAVAPPARKVSRGVIAAAAAGVLLLLGLVITLKTREGKLVLQVNEADVTVEVDEKEEKFTVTDPKGKKITIGVDPGKHKLVVKKGGFKAYTNNKIEIGWGGIKTLKVTLEPLSPERTVETASADKPQDPAAKPGPVGDWVDLLDRIEVPRDSEFFKNAVNGPWKREGNKLVSPGNLKVGQLEVPFEMPMEFELLTEVERLDGGDGCSFAFPIGGGVAEVCINQFGPSQSGLAIVDGLYLDKNGTGKVGQDLRNGFRHLVRIEVGQRAIRAWVDDKVVVDWEGDPARLGIMHSGRDSKNLVLTASYHMFRFHQLKVRELPGGPRKIPPSSAPAASWDTPEFQKWLAEVKDLPAEKLLEAVSKKMVEMNPGFSGRLEHDWPAFPPLRPRIQNDTVLEVGLLTTHVRTIAPLRAFRKLRVLVLIGPNELLSDLTPLRGLPLVVFHSRDNFKIEDISPLVGPELRELQSLRSRIQDLSPLRGLKLRLLNLTENRIRDLGPLKDMPLESLMLNAEHMAYGVTDLSPLKGMPLRTLTLRSHKRLTDISPLAGKSFERLDLFETGIRNLEALRGSKIGMLEFNRTSVTDISLLAGMGLTYLGMSDTRVADLSPLRGSKLTDLDITRCPLIKDTSLLVEFPLTSLKLTFDPRRDTEVLRAITTLKTVNKKPVAEFWKEVTAISATSPKTPADNDAWDTPEFREWLAEVKDLPAEKLLEAVSKKMVELNPGFDGKLAHGWTGQPGMQPVIEKGKVVEIGLETGKVATIAPLRAFGALRGVTLLGPGEHLSDLSPLRGMPIERLFSLSNYQIKDVSPVAGPALRELNLGESQVADLSPLSGLKLRSLGLSKNPIRNIDALAGLPLEVLALDAWETFVTDLSSLKGMPLRTLTLRSQRQLTDISPLAGMPFERLDLHSTGVKDIEPLRGSRILKLELDMTPVSDISPLAGMPLTTLGLGKTKVADLSPLRGMKLESLVLEGNPLISDTSPLAGMPLKIIWLDFEANRDTQTLRKIKTLETVNNKPVAEFWKEVAAMSATSPKPAVPQPDSGKNEWDTPEFRQWMAEVKDLPAAMLLEAVSKKMIELNPGFDGKLSHPFSHIPGPSPVIERGRVVEVGFSSQSVKNIAPLRAFGKLRALSCAGSSDPAQQPSSLVDLSPLRGMEIERLAVCWNQKLSDISPAVWPGLRELLANDSKVADLTPLRGTPLRKLLVDFSGVVDLSPLEGMPLEELGVSGDIGKTPGVSDLSPLKGMRLTFLSIAQNSSLSDISALAGMPLDWLVATGTIIDSLEPLRGIKLRQLALIRTRVTDLSPLKDMPLEALELNSTPVSDLTPLQSLPLTELNLSGCDALSDCSPLKGMSLKRVFLDFDAERDTEWLRSLKDLEQINGKPVAEFWKEVEGK